MTVREILLWLSNKDDSIDYDSVEKDIHAAVIREESVGTVSIRQSSDGDLLAEALIVTSGHDLTEWHDYDLIPKKG